MKISKQARHDARQLFKSCLVGGLLDENKVRQTVNAVAQQKPRGYMAVLSQFERLVKLDVVKHTAQIESAAPLSPQFQAQVRADLSRTYGPGLNYVFSQNPALLGGVRIQVGGDVYNGSVQARLAALQESF
jgi:F-type H+-transporting ATPase subunit delta